MSNVTINKIKYQESSGKARKYLDGKRNQISLFGEDTEAETVTDDVSVVDISAPNNVVQMPTVAQ